MSNWLVNILKDVDRRAKLRPSWARSEYAQDEIEKLTNARVAPATGGLDVEESQEKGLLLP